MNVFQLLHIPSGQYVTSINRPKTSALIFSDAQSAKMLLSCILCHRPYIGGAPLSDYVVGDNPISSDFCVDEFEIVEINCVSLSDKLVGAFQQ